jgi:4a-hydroxytetrahydrobiopterin dehydratase
MSQKLTANQINHFLSLNSNWYLNNNKLCIDFKFSDFVSALEFTNKIGKIAEEHNHHPDIFLTWGKVKLEIWTHSENALTELDLTLANSIIGKLI